MECAVLEDETGRLPVTLPPWRAAELRPLLLGVGMVVVVVVVVVVGRLERVPW